MSLLGMTIAGVGGSLASGLIGRSGQKQVNRENVNLAREQMQFQERMSSTAYQRGKKDLISAGLNPMLLAQGSPASSPSGAAPSLENPNAALAEAGSSTVRAMALQVPLMKSQIALQSENAEKARLEQLVAKEQVGLISAQARQAGALANIQEIKGNIASPMANITGQIADRFNNYIDRHAQRVFDSANTIGISPRGGSSSSKQLPEYNPRDLDKAWDISKKSLKQSGYDDY